MLPVLASVNSLVGTRVRRKGQALQRRTGDVARLFHISSPGATVSDHASGPGLSLVPPASARLTMVCMGSQACEASTAPKLQHLLYTHVQGGGATGEDVNDICDTQFTHARGDHLLGAGRAAVPLQLGEPPRSRVLHPDLDNYRRMDPHVVDTAMEAIAGGVPDKARADYVACHAGDRFVESMPYARRYTEELPALGIAAKHPDPGSDRQSTPRPRRPGRERGSSHRAACPTAVSRSPMRDTRLEGGAGGIRLDHPRIDQRQ